MNMKSVFSETLQTENLILRKWNESDAKVLFSLASDADIARWAGWLPHVDENYSRAIIRTVLSSDGEYAIVHRDIGQPIGSIGIRIGESLNRGIERKDEAEIGYWIGKKYWNNGYATEALKEVISFSFENIGLNAVWCGFFDGNEASKKVTLKCGLSYHHRNEHLFNAMRSEYYCESMMSIKAEEYFKK